jgi:hypothetical protein
VTDAAPTRIALVWRVERDDDDIQEFVGVVRGRTARSSRGADESAEEDAPTPAKAAPAPRGGHRKGSGAGRGRTGGTHRGGRPNRRGGRRR